jgi:hypothetical protein
MNVVQIWYGYIEENAVHLLEGVWEYVVQIVIFAPDVSHEQSTFLM